MIGNPFESLCSVSAASSSFVLMRPNHSFNVKKPAWRNHCYDDIQQSSLIPSPHVDSYQTVNINVAWYDNTQADSETAEATKTVFKC